MSTGMITSKSKLMLINQVVFSGKIGYALENSFSKSFFIHDNKLIGRFVAIFIQWLNFCIFE